MKRVLFVISILTTCCMIAIPALADPPANNDCENATVIGDGILQPDSSMEFSGSNIDATQDCSENNYPEVWLKFITEIPMDITISLEGTDPAFEIVSEYLFDSCPCGTGYQQSAGLIYDDGNSGGLWLGLPAGTYYFPVLLEAEEAEGDYLVTVSGIELTPPENDDCEDATVVDDGVINGGETITFTGDNTGATFDCENDVHPEAWIKFTINSAMKITVDYCGTDPVFNSANEYLYDSCPCGESINSDIFDDPCEDDNRRFLWNSLPAGTYWYPVSRTNTSVGEYTINITAVLLNGACCYDDGFSCIEIDETTCIDEYEGSWMGLGTECGEYDEESGYEGCNQATGACCYQNGELTDCIADMTESYCNENLNGDWMGENSDCGDYDEENGWSGCQGGPTTGACCYDEGFSCADTDEETCYETYDGTWIGAGTECGEYDEETGYAGCNITSTSGACCYDGGYGCVEIDNELACIDEYDGTWMGAGTECGSYNEETGYEGCQEEPVTGACCFDEGFSCEDTDETTCYDEYDGTWMGEGTDCTDADENGIADICEESDTYEYLPGDANMASETWPAQTIGGDVTYLVNYFRGLADPCKLDDFYASADATGDCMVVGGDVTYLVNYFRGLADMSYCSDYEPAWPTPGDVPTDAPDGWPNCD